MESHESAMKKPSPSSRGGRSAAPARSLSSLLLLAALGPQAALAQTPPASEGTSAPQQQQVSPPPAGAPAEQQPGAPTAPQQPMPSPTDAAIAHIREVSLKEALTLAAKQSPDIASARAQAEVARASVRRAWTAWQPDVTASGQFVHTTAPALLDFGQFVGLVGGVYNLSPQNPGILPAPVEIVGANSRYGTLQISQPLFTPQGLFLIGPAKRGSEAAALGAKEAREQVLLSVSRTYLGLQGLEQLMQAARDAEAVALRREHEARAQIEAGVAVEVALLRAQSETAQARTQLANLEGQRAQLLAFLAALVGEGVRPVPLESGPGMDWGQVREEAARPWEANYGVRASQKAVAAAEGVVTYDNFQWLPSLAAIAKGNYTSNAGFTGKNLSADFILGLSVPLYDRGARYAALAEDKAKLAKARADSESAQAKAHANWLAARANLESAKVALAQAEAQAQLADRAQKQVEAANRAGMATGLELYDADTRRFLAHSSAAQARAALEIRRAELAASEGHLADLVVPPEAE